MKRILLAILAATSVAGLGACGDEYRDPCSYGSGEDNMSDTERFQTCVLDRQEDERPRPPAREAEPPALSPEESYRQAYALEQQVESQSLPSRDSLDYFDRVQHREESRVEYLEGYLRALPSVPVARADLERAFNRAFEEWSSGPVTEHDQRFESTPYFLGPVLEAWEEGRVDKAILRPLIVRVRDRMVADSRRSGFNPARRYRPHQDFVLFANTNFGREIPAIAQLYRLTDSESMAGRQWRLQMLDYRFSFHSGETESSGEPERDFEGWELAYREYSALGYPADARRMAEMIVGGYLDMFSYGAGVSWNLGPAGLEEYLESAREWFPRVPPASRTRMIRAAISQLESTQHYEAAALLYDELGDRTNAQRMRVLAEA